MRRQLPDAAATLFAEMPVADQRHALDVADRLARAGHDDRDLLAAALLHDAGKGRRMRLWHRVGGVLLEALAPALLRTLAVERPASWRHGFWLYLHHAAVSADLAEAAGCSPATGRLIRGAPADEHEARLVRALEAADGAG